MEISTESCNDTKRLLSETDIDTSTSPENEEETTDVHYSAEEEPQLDNGTGVDDSTSLDHGEHDTTENGMNKSDELYNDEKQSPTNVNDAGKDIESGSEEIAQLVCDQCKREDVHEQADGFCQTCQDYLCDNCYTYHCKPKLMRHHVLSRDLAATLDKNVAEDKNKCSKHGNMAINIFCFKHNELGCTLCLSDEHANCNDVSFIRDCAKDFTKSEEFKKFCQDVEDVETGFQVTQKNVVECCNAIDEIHINVNLTEATEEMIRLAETIENTKIKLDDAKVVIDEMKLSMSLKCTEVLTALKDITPPTTESDESKFIATKRAESALQHYQEQLEKFKIDAQHVRGKSDLGHDIESCISLINKIHGYIIPRKKAGPPRSVVCISRFMSDANSDEVSEEQKCRITGSCVLQDGRLVFADYNNKLVKAYKPGLEKMKPFESTDRPFDVTEIEKGKIAVSVPSSKEILFLLANDQFTLSKRISTSHSCYGVASHQNKLFTATDYPPSIEVIDIEGQLLYTIEKDCGGAMLFSSPWYITLNPFNLQLYVSDRNKNTVTCLTTQGQVVTTYKANNLERPYGITVDASGIVFVCGRWSNNVHCLTEDCKLINILEDCCICKPESVTAWNKRERVYISKYDSDELELIDYEILYESIQK